ncbi:MAG: plasmid pRiA4b ORF-3 family protein [Candidatus Symbiothrix sp.]|jgi:hypothetical protein|nr:plasmid pRiA4b ORF-3 family protein [Candidatus Symbiothrix sp.]
MVYRFILVSEEVDDFRRDITIDSDATFFELHEAILDSVGYTKDQITSFFICDDDWSKKEEIILVDMGGNLDDDIYLMEETRLSERLEDEKQKLIYVFDPFMERCFFMELREIIPGQDQAKPQVVKSTGKPPKQISPLPENLDLSAPATIHPGLGLDDDYDEFGEDDEFNLDDYDEEDLSAFSEGNPFDY